MSMPDDVRRILEEKANMISSASEVARIRDEVLRRAQEMRDLMTSSPAATLAREAQSIPIDIAGPPLMRDPAHYHLASEFYERLAKWIAEYEKTLDEDTEVGVHLVSFGSAVTFHITDMSYWNPALI